MANEINNAFKAVADQVTKLVSDMTTLTVETRYIDVASQPLTFDATKPAARTDIRLDGDCTTIIPAQTGQTGALAVDSDMFELHQRSVAMAIEYRARMLGTLLQALRQSGLPVNIPSISLPSTPVPASTPATPLPPLPTTLPGGD